jgi:hypothetical protein
MKSRSTTGNIHPKIRIQHTVKEYGIRCARLTVSRERGGVYVEFGYPDALAGFFPYTDLTEFVSYADEPDLLRLHSEANGWDPARIMQLVWAVSPLADIDRPTLQDTIQAVAR